MANSCHSGTIHAFFVLIGVLIISTVHGCGQMPFGQGRAVSFTVSGFTIPSALAYSTATTVHAQVPEVSRSPEAAMALVRNLVMQACLLVDFLQTHFRVNDVLEERGRSEGLPGFVVSAILGQLTVQVSYTPIMCTAAYLTPGMQAQGMAMGCFIINGILTAICNGMNCDSTMNMMVSPIPSGSMQISGSVMTTNIIMANWSAQMWQSVFNRVLQFLRRGPFRTNFAGAFVTVM